MISHVLTKVKDSDKRETLTKLEQKYEEILAKAKKNYYDKLWNGKKTLKQAILKANNLHCRIKREHN